MDYHEAAGTQLLVTLLDWEKAFDKVDQEKLIEALKRLSITEQILAAISSLYKNPRFRSTDTLGNPEWEIKAPEQDRAVHSHRSCLCA